MRRRAGVSTPRPAATGLFIKAVAVISPGVIATADLPRGLLVETSHCILVSSEEYQNHMRHTVLERYLFASRRGEMLLALGFGSLFNHSTSPNLDYRVDFDDQVIR